jgi:tRNA (guanine37-N1)-methyltransferase
MRIFLATLFPRALDSYFETSIVKKAIQSGAVEIVVCNIADYSKKNTRRSDDRPYGGMPGTILAPEPCGHAIDYCQSLAEYPIHWICPDPRGEVLKQGRLNILSHCQNLGILCGHYEGIDERVLEEYKIQKVSLGEYILTGGEIAAGAIIDGISRLLPGVLHENSLMEESFSERLGGKKEYPHYTRPEIWRGRGVPSELLSGNPKIIEQWKQHNIL